MHRCQASADNNTGLPLASFPGSFSSGDDAFSLPAEKDVGPHRRADVLELFLLRSRPCRIGNADLPGHQLQFVEGVSNLLLLRQNFFAYRLDTVAEALGSQFNSRKIDTDLWARTNRASVC